MTSAAERAHWASVMAEAAALSERARGLSRPNPPVGAIILDSEGQVVGRGHTRAVGGPHAEVVALSQAGPRANNGTAVVTLEPCAHTGRTGPCTAALIEAGIGTVVFAVTDPNPPAAGGAGVLAAAGVRVERALTEEIAAGPLQEWLFAQRHGRAMVTAKLALTLDGRVAAPDGTSQWITGEAARAHAHRVREQLDAIIIGTGTALADDPALTARTGGGALTPRQPQRIVLGQRELPPGARVHGPGGALTQVRSHDPRDALAVCPEAANVLVEGGPTVIGAFVDAGLIDRIDVYLAPTLLGNGPAAVDAPMVQTLSDRLDFSVQHSELLGTDVWMRLLRR